MIVPTSGHGSSSGLIAENHEASPALSQKQFADSERRLLIRLEHYWRSLRQSARGPFIEDFRISRNPVPWEDCFIAHVGGSGAELAFDHIGNSIVALFKPDRTNRLDGEWLLDTIRDRFGEPSTVLETASPARGEGRFCRPDGMVVLYRSMLLPFVDAKREPAYMVGAMTYRLDTIP